MPLRIFASRNVTGANLVQVLGTAGMFGMFFLGSLYLRQIQGYHPLQIGLAFLPVAAVMGAPSVRYTDRLVMWFGARTLLFPGLGLIAPGLGLAVLATVSASRANALIAQHRPTAVAPTEGYHLAFWIAFGLVVAAIAAAAALLRPQRAAAAEPQTAPELAPAIQAD